MELAGVYLSYHFKQISEAIFSIFEVEMKGGTIDWLLVACIRWPSTV